MLIRALLALLLIVAVDWAPGIPPYPILGMAQVKAQTPPYPPDVWHPYRGGVNCVQVADSQGRFNCAPGTTIDPATGNMVVGGTLAFQGLAAGTFSNGLALAPVNSGVQLLGAGDLVISTSGPNVLASGPLIQGVVLRVRRSPTVPGYCRVVVAGGNFVGEYAIALSPPGGLLPPNIGLYASPGLPEVIDFPGGPLGC